MPRPSDHQADVERQVAPEGTHRAQDETLVRRLTRERRLARETVSATPGQARPRGEGPAKG
jgi:hypothetical protein